MNMYRLTIILIVISVVTASCGKPTVPESLFDEKYGGGYKFVSNTRAAGYAQDIVKRGDLAYIAQGQGGLMILKVANPQKPEILSVSSDEVRGYSSKLAMKDTVVYLATGSFGITALDVSNPEKPMITAPNLSIKPAKNIHVSGNYMFTAISEQGIKIADISFAAQPDIRGKTKTQGYAQSVDITSDTNFMLVACGEMGLSVFNISQFDNGFGTFPLSAWVDTPGYAEDVCILENESVAFMACGKAGLQIVDFSDTSNVRILGSFYLAGYAKEVVYQNQRVYMTNEKAGLQIIDVSDLSKPELVGYLITGFALGVDVDEDFVYVADENEGLVIISIPEY
jgi:hypothetical protein